MIIVVLPSDETPEDRARSRARELAQFLSIVDDRTVHSIDRTPTRYVLCGDHGYREAKREACPECGGYAEWSTSERMTRRLRDRAPVHIPVA